MYRTDLDREVARRLGLSIEHVSTVTGMWFELARETLARGEEVTVRSFGSFNIFRRAALLTRSFAGDIVKVAPLNRVSFTQSENLKHLVNR